MGDRLATIDMGGKVRGCCAPFCGHSSSPLFGPCLLSMSMSEFGPTVSTSRHGLMKTNLFGLKPTTLSVYVLSHQSGFQSLTALYHYKIRLTISHLLEPPEHFHQNSPVALLSYMIFGRPFEKRFALCYRTVDLSCLSVCDIGVL